MLNIAERTPNMYVPAVRRLEARVRHLQVRLPAADAVRLNVAVTTWLDPGCNSHRAGATEEQGRCAVNRTTVGP